MSKEKENEIETKAIIEQLDDTVLEDVNGGMSDHKKFVLSTVIGATLVAALSGLLYEQKVKGDKERNKHENTFNNVLNILDGVICDLQGDDEDKKIQANKYIIESYGPEYAAKFKQVCNFMKTDDVIK